MILIAAILVLAIWAFFTFAGNAPGAIHALLTIGVFLIIYHFTSRDTKSPAAKSGRKS